MGIPLNLDFEMGVSKPIDSRLVMTKAQMLSVNDDVMPVVYGCWCSDDGKPYIYNKNNPVDAQLGKFKQAPDAQDIIDVTSMFKAYDAYSEEINTLRTELESVKATLKSNKDKYIVTSQVFESGEWRKDFLPDHEKSYFCTEANLKYSAEYTAVGTDSIFVNGKTIQLDTEHEVGVLNSTTIRVVAEYGVVNVYENGTLIDTLSNDTFVLTLGVTLSNADLETCVIDKLETSYSYLEYRDIRIYSKNDFPITETYEGSVLYWTRRPQMGGSPAGAYQHSFSAKHSKAVYAIGNNWAADLYYMFNVAWQGSSWTYTEGSFMVEREAVIEYMYTSHWDLSKVTCLQSVATFSGTTAINHDYQKNRDYVDNYMKRLEWSDVIWPTVPQVTHKAGSPCYFNLMFTYNTKSCGNLSQAGTVMKLHPKYSRMSFSGNYSIESYGDISGWDVTNFIRFDELFAQNFNLSFMGDVGKWKLGVGNDSENVTVIKNIFRFCFKLKGISSAISQWDVSKSAQLNGIFQGAMCIGDDTLVNLWQWNTHNTTNFGEIFSYLTPSISHGWKARYSPSYTQEWATICEEYQDPNTTEERKEELEWQLIEVNKTAIQAPRTDLSFIEKWDMTSATQTRDMCAYNPYLINAGDLRLWNFGVTDGSLWTELGASGMFAYCTALETLKIPSIPRGVNVDKIVKGCISLANIEVNELNVEAISFQDCPLTKQSVLNLVNAATDDVTITLKADIYSTMVADADVQSAIADKFNDGITVNLATNA